MKKLRIVKNLGVVDEKDRLIFFIPEPGRASLSEFDAPDEFEERIKLVQEIVDTFNKSQAAWIATGEWYHR